MEIGLKVSYPPSPHRHSAFTCIIQRDCCILVCLVLPSSKWFGATPTPHNMGQDSLLILNTLMITLGSFGLSGLGYQVDLDSGVSPADLGGFFGEHSCDLDTNHKALVSCLHDAHHEQS